MVRRWDPGLQGCALCARRWCGNVEITRRQARRSSGSRVLHSDLLGSEGGVSKTQLHSFGACNAVLIAGIVPWAWIPGENG